MTIIAWDGKTLAADSRNSQSTFIVSDGALKIYKINNVEYLEDTLLYIGLSGSLCDFDKVMSFIHSEEFPSSNIRHNVAAIVVGKKFVYCLEPDCGFLIRYSRKTHLAEGCGAPYALSAMKLGLDAKKAVKHTISLDHGCGGKIRSVEV